MENDPTVPVLFNRKRKIISLLITLISWQHLGISAEKGVLEKHKIPS